MVLGRTLEPEVMDSAEEAHDYDHMDHSTVNQLFVDDLLTVLRGAELEDRTVRPLQVLDLGTGTLQIPVRLLTTWPRCGPITACDLSFEMLRLGHRHLVRAGLQGRVLPVLCDAKNLPVADHRADVIISNSIVNHIPKPQDVFREVRRCIRPGGLVFFRDLLRPETENQVERLVLTYAANENAHSQKMFRESLHAALTLDEVRDLLTDIGLPRHSVLQTSDRHWTVSCLVP